MEANIFEQMKKDSVIEEESTLPEDKLKALTYMVKRMQDVAKEIEKQNEVLEKLNKRYEELRCAHIPDLFDELNLSKITLSTGELVSVKREFLAHITEANKEKAFSWLNENGHGAIIKHDVTVKIKKGGEEQYKDLISDIALFGLDYADKQYVHPGTLKAFVNEQMNGAEDNGNIPQDVFGVYPLRITKIS